MPRGGSGNCSVVHSATMQNVAAEIGPLLPPNSGRESDRRSQAVSMHSSKALHVGLTVLARFERANAERQAQGARLRQLIRAIVESHTGPERLTAKRILRQLAAMDGATLGRELPSLRTVQWHLRAIRTQHVGVARSAEAP